MLSRYSDATIAWRRTTATGPGARRGVVVALPAMSAVEDASDAAPARRRQGRRAQRGHPAARPAARRRRARPGRATRSSSSSRASAGAPSTPAATAAARSPTLAETLPDRSIDDQLHLIRAFGWLSLLANTAEDVHHERRRRYHRAHGSRPQVGSVEATLDHLARRRRRRATGSAGSSTTCSSCR